MYRKINVKFGYTDSENPWGIEKIEIPWENPWGIEENRIFIKNSTLHLYLFDCLSSG
jgi:hypothetical protein